MSNQKLALIDGNYPSLMSGGVVAAQGSKSDDLDDFKGSTYYGKSYYWIGGQTPSNAPSGANGGILFIQRCGGVSAAQTFITHRSSNGTTPPVVYQRSQSSTEAWSDWEEVVTSDGNYPNLGVGHLQEIQINTRSSDTVGWYKCGEFDVSRNTGSGDLSCSVILQINGTNYGNYSERPINAAPSGQIEVDARITSGAFVNRYSSVGIISGNIASTDFCICSSDDGKKMNLYVNISHTHRDFKITKISEGQENVPSPNIFEFTDEYYGASAPANAVYAVVRNNASADDNGYSFDTNYVWHNNGQAEENTLKDGTISLDFNDYLEEGKYELHGYADNPAVNFPTSSSNTSETNCDWYLVVYVRGTTYVAQVAYSARADGSIAIRTLSNGTWGNWRLLFDNGVVQQIPAASQTVLGGVKAYTDSDGYFCIDNE